MYVRALPLCVGLIAAAPASEAATITCPSGDVPCLIAAIHAANANGEANTIRLAAGAYTLTAEDNSTDGPTGLPSVTGTLTIAGAGAGVTTVERAADASKFRIFHVGSEGVLTLRRMTIRGGDAQVFGGGAVSANGSVLIHDAVITGNRAGSTGGGVTGGNVVVTRTVLTGNFSPSGAIVHVTRGGDLTIRNSTIAQNLGGGGVWFTSPGTLTIADTLISGGSGHYGAGGVFITESGAIATITDSTISGNEVGDATGGGIAAFSGTTVTIDRSSIVDNVADNIAVRSGGGGISAGNATLIIRNSTVARNHSWYNGSGLSVSSGATVTVTGSTITDNVIDATPMPPGAGILGPVRLENSVLARNTSLGFSSGSKELNCLGPITSLGHNLISDPTNCGDLQPTDVIADPGIGAFVDPGRPGAGHYPLLAGSLAIDAGNDEGCSSRDQQGLVRGIDGDGDSVRHCDIGAIEFYPVVNDSVRLDLVHSTFVPPNPTQPNPQAAGGTYLVDAAFTNVGSENICRVAFEVVTLDAASGVASVLTGSGQLLGREGVEFPATIVGARANLRVGDQERYRFTIGVTESAPLTFFVNMLGERAGARCSARSSGSAATRDAAIPEPD